MEKDQNINSENQDEEIKATKSEELIQEKQEISAEGSFNSVSCVSRLMF